MTDQPKIYENLTIIQSIERMLEDGYRPATLKEVWDLRKQRKIPMRGYSTGTLFLEGEIKDATIEQLKNIEETYKTGGRLLYLGGSYDVSLVGYDLNGQFVGVRAEGASAKISKPSLEKRLQ